MYQRTGPLIALDAALGPASNGRGRKTHRAYGLIGLSTPMAFAPIKVAHSAPPPCHHVVFRATVQCLNLRSPATAPEGPQRPALQPHSHKQTTMFPPPEQLPPGVKFAWSRESRASFCDSRLVHRKYWQDYNTITIPLLSPEEFYADALAAARGSETVRELESTLEKKSQQRRHEIKQTFDSHPRKHKTTAQKLLLQPQTHRITGACRVLRGR